MIFTSRNKRLVANVEKLKELEQKVDELNQENKELLQINLDRQKAIEKIIAEKSQGFPWVAGVIAEFYSYPDKEIESYLKWKKHPAYKSAEAVRAVAREKKLLRKRAKVAQNFVNYYETLFPWITEYVGDDLDTLLEGLNPEEESEDEDLDPVLRFIPRSEYKQLPAAERNQKALDHYLASRKSPRQIGRDYERYIGYLYEEKGYKVEYVGIEKGLEDLGRDLICSRGDELVVVQCKCWASHKTIHEKHINQLYGTAVKHYLERENLTKSKGELTLFPDLMQLGWVSAAFVTSTSLSETALKFARALGVKVIQNKKLDKYPMIKCNIAHDGEKIYHLPFDQQYDKTNVMKNHGFYASTTEEAESKGFRRAYRWRGH